MGNLSVRFGLVRLCLLRVAQGRVVLGKKVVLSYDEL